SLDPFVVSPPQILPSSGCIRAAAHINCSCETEGNPSPAVEWQMDGRPVNDSDAFTIRHEPLNATGLVRSFITINSQGKDLSTLVCHSTNSVGSASQVTFIHLARLKPTGTDPKRFTIAAEGFTIQILLYLYCISHLWGFHMQNVCTLAAHMYHMSTTNM
uniref:Ig-like domain-containing protein n=1 Tax=Myripristis murdjan TaxID=586833 RepID=A0A668ALC4_9TELE